MKSVVKEYAGAILALAGCICILTIVKIFFFGSESFFAIMICSVVQGG